MEQNFHDLIQFRYFLAIFFFFFFITYNFAQLYISIWEFEGGIISKKVSRTLEGTFAQCTCTFRKGRCREPAIRVHRSPTRTPLPAQGIRQGGPSRAKLSVMNPLLYLPPFIMLKTRQPNFLRPQNLAESSLWDLPRASRVMEKKNRKGKATIL